MENVNKPDQLVRLFFRTIQSRNRLHQNYDCTLLLKDGQDFIPEYTIGLITSTPTREKKNIEKIIAGF